MDMIENKEQTLHEFLSHYQSALVAFSGGIDSTVVLKEALNTLGTTNVKAVVVNSELFTNEEFEKAISFAKALGADVITSELDYLSDEHIKNNTPDSWYFAKKMFYSRMNELADNYELDVVLDGMIMDDLKDYRPGLKAKDEAGAVSPLQQANYFKVDVREYAKNHGLTNWNKIPSCSVSSRFPYNTPLTKNLIARVIKSESYLRSLGFPVVRVRSHGNLARIEVPLDRMLDLENKALEINEELKKLGFEFVTTDLGGFVSGHMNETLSKKTLSEYTNKTN
ncbi:TIGR00268 family protein (plasmid) [Lactiplantibacillus plantarum subsp. plantarum]|nr:TIGR00268 family protein [Lactiplantibacillus plantarum subsp. plantarum]